MSEHKFPYKWNLADGYPAKGIEKHGLKVFGTFVCGGGSTMGYKLAGYDHLGGVEIDKPIAQVYKTNHNPKYLYVEDLRLFNQREDLPDELYQLDLLDGSPPCSNFSMAGNREKDWGKEKHFREGQTTQVLDDLVFVYCDTIIKLKPKAFLLENVKGIIQGNAKSYSKKIVAKMTAAGYVVQVFLLNAASMGVPQKRERVFFIGHKKELKYSKLMLEFNERAVRFGEIEDINDNSEDNQKQQRYLWDNQTKQDKGLNDVSIRLDNKNNFFSHCFLQRENVMPTITAHSIMQHWLKHKPRHPNNQEIILAGTYPQDYNFKNIEVGYLIGMSVPPVMTAQIAHQIYLQWHELK